MNEFRPIPNYSPYEITYSGVVKGQRVRTLKHWIPINSKANYPCVCMFGVRTFVHRLVALAWIPNPNNYPYINHKDGDKLNCHGDNLEWCTAEYNANHAKENGMGRKGKQIHTCILDETQVLTIRRCYQDGAKIRQLSSYFKVSRSTIQFITSRRNWKHL